MLEDISAKQLCDLVKLFSQDKFEATCPWQIDKKYFIRTVTMHLIGKLKFISSKELVLSNAAWVADSGRFNHALETGELSEVEPFVSDVILNRESIVDATEWKHETPSMVE